MGILDEYCNNRTWYIFKLNLSIGECVFVKKVVITFVQRITNIYILVCY